MRATRSHLVRHAADLATRLWTMGADLDGDPVMTVKDDGTMTFRMDASLPDSGIPDRALLTVREEWRSIGREFERVAYAYELIDHPRRRRRAFHRHDTDRFLAVHDVAVHEHCEETLGLPACDHYAGDPVPDGYRGIELLLLAWTDEPLGCNGLRCLA